MGIFGGPFFCRTCHWISTLSYSWVIMWIFLLQPYICKSPITLDPGSPLVTWCISLPNSADSSSLLLYSVLPSVFPTVVIGTTTTQPGDYTHHYLLICNLLSPFSSPSTSLFQICPFFGLSVDTLLSSLLKYWNIHSYPLSFIFLPPPFSNTFSTVLL